MAYSAIRRWNFYHFGIGADGWFIFKVGLNWNGCGNGNRLDC